MAGKLSCWKYFLCEQKKCPAYGRELVECWREPNTLCHEGENPLPGWKFERCMGCAVFLNSIDDEAMCQNIASFYEQIKEQGFRPNSVNEELTIEFSAIYRMLAKLSKGDFAARLSLSPSPGMVGTLKSMLNDVAAQMQEYVEETHELAIGLCEHYEILNRISRDEYTARASEDSPNELIAKLGFLINKCTDNLTSSISRLQYAEEETKNAYQQLLDIVDFLPDATFVIDSEGRIIAWNLALQELTGVSKEEMLGKGDYAYSISFYGYRRKVLIDYLADGTDKAVRKYYTNVRRTHNTLSGEATIKPLGPRNVRNVWVTATPLYDKLGNRAGGIESIRDVTELKRAQEEKARLETQLQHSRQMESLMLKLGHDLKTPLTPLFTLLPLIRERIDDPETRRMVEICCDNATQIMDLSSKTMRIASLSPSAGEPVRERLDLAQAVAAVCRENVPLLGQKNISCEILIPAGIFILAVPDQIRDLFSNLLSNAVNASPAGSSIKISARNMGNTVTVTVQDVGVGLTAEDRESIFEEFFKVDQARQDVSASGLGLSICKRIVLNHNGRIWAESKGPGRGTTVVFTMPQAPG